MVRLVISDPDTGKAYQLEPEESQANSLIGLKIGEKIEGEKIDLDGYEIKITGGTDEEGFPMRPDVKGVGRTKALLSKGTGYKPKREGERRRKTVRGNVVSGDVIQLNAKITEHGQKPIEQVLGLEKPTETSEDEEGTETKEIEDSEEKVEEEAEAKEEKPEEAEERESKEEES